MCPFHKNLKILREEKQMSQKELARYAGVSQQAVNRWETAIFPNIDKLIFLSRFFHVSIDDLLTTPISGQPSNEQEFVSSSLPLNSEETHLLQIYRSMDPELRQEMKDLFLSYLTSVVQDPNEYSRLRKQYIQEFALPYAARHGNNAEGMKKLKKLSRLASSSPVTEEL